MKNVLIKNRSIYAKSVFLFFVFILTLFACVYLDNVSIMQIQEDGTEAPFAKAGSIATFTVDGNINSAEDHRGVKFVVSFLAPKSWDVAKHARVTYKTTLHTNIDELLTMSVIPDATLPKSGGGLTWGQKLMDLYGVGLNVLQDMEWVSFQTDLDWEIFNGEKPKYTIYIKTNVGEQNLKFYPSFFVNHTDDGISTSGDHKKVQHVNTPFEVIDGKGLLIDYCNDHYNKVQPLASLQDDYVTFTFNGLVYDNELVTYDEIFLESVVFDFNGRVINRINERSDKTLLKRETPYSYTYSLTMWPADFFNVPDGTLIDRMEYIFTNRSGTVTITKSDDDLAVDGTEIIGEKEPFVFEFLCE